jgi:hypothetical protein
MKARLFMIAVALHSVGCYPAWAQTALGEVVGEIKDASGTVIARAPVALTNQATGVPTSLVTNEAGVFFVRSLQPGVYRIEASSPGFKTFVATNVELRTGQVLRYDIVLQVGDVTRTLRDAMPYVKVFHIADNPGRNDPGTGEMNYPYLYKEIQKAGYKGYLTMEYIPLGDQVKSLHLWAPVVSDDRVEVVLFDHPETLLQNLAVLGRLRAHVRLDLGSLFARGWSGQEALELADRYLLEAEWKVSLEPFEGMLMAAVRGERVPLKNVLGLTPGRYRSCLGSLAGLSDEGRSMVKDLLASETVVATAYFADHRGCMDCKSFVVCGSRLSSFEKGGCSEALRRLAAQLQSTAMEIRNNLSEENA